MDSCKAVQDSIQSLLNNCTENSFPWYLLIVLIFVLIVLFMFKTLFGGLIDRIRHIEIQKDGETSGTISLSLDADSTHSENAREVIPHTDAILKSEEKKKILWTLYATQKELFKDDKSKRFTLAFQNQSIADANQLY